MIDRLLDYLKAKIDGQPIKGQLTSKRKEEEFNRRFLSPAIADFFHTQLGPELGLTHDKVRCALGTEGHANCPGFGFSPGLENEFFFTKDQVLKNAPPPGWVHAAEMKAYRPYPDFAIRGPNFPTLVGGLKYAQTATANSALKILYNVTRQCVFYLGAFRGEYRAALAVIADGSPDHIVAESYESLHTRLRSRFGPATGVYCLILKID